MSSETPLPEVARLLGAATAKRLDREPPNIQMIVLIALRSYVILLESEGVLDPISLQERLHKFVESFVMAYKGQRYA